MSGSWDDDDDFLFEEDDEVNELNSNTLIPWVMLIVDDEPGIHDVTKLALKRFTYEGANLEILSAFSGEEALNILKSRDDIAVILLDVVMETDHAGLDCARQIRDDLHNDSVRIVLRTGQPGQAPEEEVILAYDINDYRAKTELTTTRLFTTVVSALRNYRDIRALSQYREDAYGVLAENAQSVQTLIELSDTPLFQLGHDLYVQRCNKAFASLFNQEPEKLIGLGVGEFSSQDFLGACHEKNEHTEILLNGIAYNLCLQEMASGICGNLKVKDVK